MNYDEQIKKWAASRTGLFVDEIKSVEFEMSEGRWWSDITYEEGYKRAVVNFFRESGRLDHRYIDLEDFEEDFGGLIREIMDA